MRVLSEGSDAEMAIDDDQVSELEPEEEEEQASEEDELSTPPTPPPQPRLRIKLKLPAAPSSGTSTPQFVGSTREPSRDVDIESEDEDDDGEVDISTPSSGAGPSTKPLTARQAVLASVVDPSHVSLVSLPTEPSRKKKQLNEAEIALRREETARKRKNMTEKKLEDEKAETINRLLKKQSRPKNKRTMALSTSTPADIPTPSVVTRDASLDPDGAENGSADSEPTLPKMYRWVSSSVTGEGGERSMVIGFSVPVDAIPTIEPGSHGRKQVPVRDRTLPKCDVAGCREVRKYKLVKDWRRGACGMDHLKALESMVAS